MKPASEKAKDVMELLRERNACHISGVKDIENAITEARREAFEEAGRILSVTLKMERAEFIEPTCCDERERAVLMGYSKQMWARSREVCGK